LKVVTEIQRGHLPGNADLLVGKRQETDFTALQRRAAPNLKIYEAEGATSTLSAKKRTQHFVVSHERSVTQQNAAHCL